MNTLFKLSKTLTLLMVIFLVTVGTSCQEKEKNKGNYFGSSQRDDICQLITATDIRSVFELDDQIKIDQKEKKSAICSYDWQAPTEKKLFYSVKLNFAMGDRRTSSEIDKVWEKQNKMAFEKRDFQKVPGVGDKASWSDLGGGQLRVTANGYIFFVSFFVTPGKDNPLDTQGMIDKTSALAKQVIKKM